jgi:hypothetical protein
MSDARDDFETRSAELAGVERSGDVLSSLGDPALDQWAEAVDRRLAELDRRLVATEQRPADASAGHDLAAAAAEVADVRKRLALVAAILVELDSTRLDFVAYLVGNR